ncbi:MAG TPA: DUF4124 domain-containing protein [Rudaea sp.]|nr:DUF4124 domain-containing protein [Rudaea sp.]
MSKRCAHLVILFTLCVTGAHALEVYKCTNAQGDVAYQDKPCARSDSEVTLRLSDQQPAPPEPPPAEQAPAPPPPAPAPAAVERPSRPLPALWVCANAEDGSRYISRNGSPPPRLVPLGVLGYPPKTLAEAYPPGASNRMSAPEMSKVPVDTSARGSIGAGYTQVQDQCVRLSPEQTCDALRQQYDQLSDKLNHARFKDEQAKLGAEVDDIEKDLRGCN